MTKPIICIVLLVYGFSLAKAQQVMQLYDNDIEVGNQSQEQITYTESGEINIISQVTVPSITLYLPDPGKATGTAVILCPGGGLRMLSWQNDVINMARWLNERGIAAIGLKYRLRTDAPDPASFARRSSNDPANTSRSGKNDTAATAQSNSSVPATAADRSANQNNPMVAMNLKITDYDKVPNGNANPDMSEASLETIDRAIEDAKEAIRLTRKHAADWNIDPDKVGYLGFSAGGGVALGAAIQAEEEAMPDFIATAYGPSLIDVTVPDNAPNLLICTRADHPNVAAGLLALFLEWKKAGANAELYVYDDGRMGFGPDDSGSTSGTWREGFYRWLISNGF